jgi:hypothetical protein
VDISTCAYPRLSLSGPTDAGTDNPGGSLETTAAQNELSAGTDNPGGSLETTAAQNELSADRRRSAARPIRRTRVAVCGQINRTIFVRRTRVAVCGERELLFSFWCSELKKFHVDRQTGSLLTIEGGQYPFSPPRHVLTSGLLVGGLLVGQ